MNRAKTNVEKICCIGRMLAAAANAAKGTVSVVIPIRGVAVLDSIGGGFWDPEADRVGCESITGILNRASR